MERGSRIVTCLQTLEKITVSSQKPSAKFGPEDLQQLRCVTSKILQYLQTQDKSQRDIIIKNGAYVDLILNVLENAKDTCTQHNLLLVLNELIGKSQISRRVSTLVLHEATRVLFQILVLEAKETHCSEDLLFTVHQVLAKLGPKDHRFGSKARQNQALGVTLGLLKTFASNPRLLPPVVHVLKLYAANAVNASYLGKNGAISYLFKIISIAGRKHLSVSKYAFDTLALLVKSKSNSARAIGQGGVPVLLNTFYDWHRADSKNRHINLRKSILSVLKNVTNLKSGRKALMEADGIRLLYTTCQESVECREVDSLIFMASHIMRKCFPKNHLPLCSLRSPITCRLPQSDFHIPDPGEGQDGFLDPGLNIGDKSCINGDQIRNCGDENGYESSVDNDDDISSGDDTETHKPESDDDGAIDGNSNAPYKRTIEDLMMYQKFFAELHEFDAILEEEVTLMPSFNPIVIPTALNDQNISDGRKQNSAQNLLTSTEAEEAFSNTLEKMKLDRDDEADDDSNFFITCRPRSKNRDQSAENLFELPSQYQGASAINLKTGLSVFTLDIPSSLPTMKTVPPIQANRSPKMKRRASKTSKTKDKKKSKLKEDDWCSYDPLQPLSVMSYMRGLSVEDDVMEDDRVSSGNPDQDDGKFSFGRYDSPDVFADIAASTKSVGRFNKLAYPDMYGHVPPPYKEPLYEKRFGIQRQKIFEDIDRFINPEQTIDRTVYDLDAIVNTAGPMYSGVYSNLINSDEVRVARQEDTTDHLRFNAQFECGNLRKAIQIRKYEYDLILNPDTNTNHHHQWFYFEVSNMEAGVKYRFNIVNCEKLNSQFNFGMKPVMFSVAEAMQGRPYWTRAGSEICYYKNHYLRSTQTTGGVKGKTYYTTTFTITFKHEKDVCYLAYHYPYSYSMLQYHLHRLEESYDSNLIYYRKDDLCHTIGGNPVPVLTITSHPANYDREGIEQFKNRPYIFLSARVHPGESNSSWVMKGTISYLLSNKASAQSLRDQYIFKIVPMLNPDGVINGTHRCSLVAEDLNRRWLYPCPKLHPTIYHTKGLLQYMNAINKTPLVYCDYHGHSRKKNVFLYGCSPSLSWMTEDDNTTNAKMEDTSYKTLPKAVANIAPAFSLSSCCYMVEKAKESTARVVVWRQLGVSRSYTMESSYCGCDQGPYRGYHLSTRELEEMGRKFCEALSKVRSRHPRVSQTSSVLEASDKDRLLAGVPRLQDVGDPGQIQSMYVPSIHMSHRTQSTDKQMASRSQLECMLKAGFHLNGSEEQSTAEHLASYANDQESSSDSDICEARGDCGVEDEDPDDGDDDEEEEDEDDDDDDTAYLDIMASNHRDQP